MELLASRAWCSALVRGEWATTGFDVLETKFACRKPRYGPDRLKRPIDTTSTGEDWFHSSDTGTPLAIN